MTDGLYQKQKKEIIERIQQYDGLIKSYQEDDLPKDREELERMTLDDLNDWLNTRITYYQFQVDADIVDSNPGCQGSISEENVRGQP